MANPDWLTQGPIEVCNVRSQKWAVVAGGSYANGANVCQWEPSGNDDQLWNIYLVVRH